MSRSDFIYNVSGEGKQRGRAGGDEISVFKELDPCYLYNVLNSETPWATRGKNSKCGQMLQKPLSKCGQMLQNFYA